MRALRKPTYPPSLKSTQSNPTPPHWPQLFYAPKYAILDECTSAVSADGEQKLIAECVRAGVTMLSIGHRPALRQFHSMVRWELPGGAGAAAHGRAGLLPLPARAPRPTP